MICSVILRFLAKSSAIKPAKNNIIDSVPRIDERINDGIYVRSGSGYEVMYVRNINLLPKKIDPNNRSTAIIFSMNAGL